MHAHTVSAIGQPSAIKRMDSSIIIAMGNAMATAISQSVRLMLTTLDSTMPTAAQGWVGIVKIMLCPRLVSG